VDAGVFHTCARAADGSAWCWGESGHGEVGAGSTNGTNVPTAVLSGFTWSGLRAGLWATCGVATDGTLWCWGWLLTQPSGSSTNSSVPVMIGSSTDWASVAPGQGGACATRTDDSLWCWGDNDGGEVGDGTRWGETPAAVVFP
jgi:hypothetical protein